MLPRFYAIFTKIGPIIADSKYTNAVYSSDQNQYKLRKEAVRTKSINVAKVTTSSEMDQFLKLELVYIQEQPNGQEDEKTLEQFKQDKSTPKLRIVCDASVHLKGRKSLNDVLYRSPTTLSDLAGILLRFTMM
ncbi:unnamed protein product [Acanthocheilonema viteae]|uniref:Uncharacterized protein n=1 Tax=Acanthocheilonema viteae TaxID=6277 RepID=A0A498SN10_ACAVI|nr:unnamed protein product [Acanthocheilonema viteae]